VPPPSVVIYSDHGKENSETEKSRLHARSPIPALIASPGRREVRATLGTPVTETVLRRHHEQVVARDVHETAAPSRISHFQATLIHSRHVRMS